MSALLALWGLSLLVTYALAYHEGFYRTGSGRRWWALAVHVCCAVRASWCRLTRAQRRWLIVSIALVLITIEYAVMYAHRPAAAVLSLVTTIALTPFVLIMTLPMYYGIRQNIEDAP